MRRDQPIRHHGRAPYDAATRHDELARHDELTRAVASAGREGLLQLRFEAGERGTRLASRRCVAPLRVHRAFRAPGGTAIVQIVHIGPGMLAGDVSTIDVHVAPGAAAIVVPQSAAKIHAMGRGTLARQDVRLRVEAGGYLEMHGPLGIPFPGATFEQRATVDLDPGATMLWTERWTTGRDLASERRGAFRRLSSRIEVRIAGELRYADATELIGTADDGDEPRAGTMGILDGHAHVASGVFVGAVVDEVPEVAGVALGRFGDDGLYLRCLTDDAATARRAVFGVAGALRAAHGRSPLAYGRYAA